MAGWRVSLQQAVPERDNEGCVGPWGCLVPDAVRWKMPRGARQTLQPSCEAFISLVRAEAWCMGVAGWALSPVGRGAAEAEWRRRYWTR